MASERDVAELARALPGVTEGLSYGTSAWRVAGRIFLRIHDQPGVVVAWCEDEHAKRSLVQADPEIFSTTGHYVGHSSVLVRLEAIDDVRLAEVVVDAYRARAPRRLLDRLAHS